MAQWTAVFLLFLCGLFPYYSTAACVVNCTTDFISRLNCTAPVSQGTAACEVLADCRDEFNVVNGNCSIRAPQSWCIMEPEGLDMIMSFDTNCSFRTTQVAKEGDLEMRESDPILLYKSIKLKQPFNLKVTNTNEGFNLTWDVAYIDEKLSYRVRVRTRGSKKEQTYIFDQEQQSMGILSENLQPGNQYVADVQVAVNPQWFTSMWSEWSDSTEWTTDSAEPEQYYLLLLVLPVLILVLLVYSGKLAGIKKRSLWQRIPSPQEYFTPLYHTYQGDFKKWVGPILTFSSMDVLEKSTPLQVMCVKPLNEPDEQPIRNEAEQDTCLPKQNTSKLYFLGSRSPDFTHSGGHISVDTVVVSGQEGIMGNWSGNSSRQNLDDRQRDPNNIQPLLPDASGSLQGLDCDDWHLQEHYLENMEQVSLDSYSSNEQSEDGYPRMELDLDTIDSGFLESECSSPSAFDGKEQMETLLMEGVGESRSNYVKQSVDFTAIRVDAHSSGK
ncbi:hypothetical protein DNTS_015823 [Danionella cerebrum]|uniref:Fibronectin type-III domain-containing protein n=1 Tax=Danionella cerebrum TaxID=2873325 RepID=A0A553Q8K4_9TELE|nr:hypothetical protein DNTS_015823 [Danionella translucida]